MSHDVSHDRPAVAPHESGSRPRLRGLRARALGRHRARISNAGMIVLATGRDKRGADQGRSADGNETKSEVPVRRTCNSAEGCAPESGETHRGKLIDVHDPIVGRAPQQLENHGRRR